MSNAINREATFEITEKIGVITEYSTGWKRELNIVSWNEGTPKYDIRDWNSDHSRMSRGITLTEDEMEKVITLLENMSTR